MQAHPGGMPFGRPFNRIMGSLMDLRACERTSSNPRRTAAVETETGWQAPGKSSTKRLRRSRRKRFLFGA
jgi:hypothetical protein